MISNNLEGLKKSIMSMADRVQTMFERSINSILNHNATVLEEIFKIEEEVNNFEIEIERLCTSTIALYQPEAKDLRTVLMIYKINSDLERMGDQAVNISESCKYLIDTVPLGLLKEIIKMSQITFSMVKDCFLAFSNEDIFLSQEICRRDNLVDNYQKEIIKLLIEEVKANTNNVESAFHIIRIIKNLERTADLTTNIAEEIIFMVKGKIIKHNLI